LKTPAWGDEGRLGMRVKGVLSRRPGRIEEVGGKERGAGN